MATVRNSVFHYLTLPGKIPRARVKTKDVFPQPLGPATENKKRGIIVMMKMKDEIILKNIFFNSR